MKKQAIVGDILLNILASTIPTVVLQLIVLPSLASDMTEDAYGVVVSLLALLNMVSFNVGNTLCNVRLIRNQAYEDKKESGDFNRILIYLGGLNLIVVGVVVPWMTESIRLPDILLTLLLSVLWLVKEYFVVAFRIKINYKQILLNSLIMVAGYGVGYGLFVWLRCWQLIYIAGYAVSLVYIFSKTSLQREPTVKTHLYPETKKTTIKLTVSNLLSSVNSHTDKLIVFPILGGADVSVYYTASLLGKIVGLIITPVNTVILTYLSKKRQKDDHLFRFTLLLGIIVSIIGYFGCLIFAKPVLSLLYPQYVDEAMCYISVTAATTMFNLLFYVVKPFILKFFDSKYQIYLNGGSALVYVLLGGALCRFYGLMGFCIGALITNVVKFISVLIICIRAKALS